MGIILDWESNYPSSLDTINVNFPVLEDDVHVVRASHVNELAKAVVALEEAVSISGSIASKYEGDTLTSTTSSINFTGEGVTASAIANDVTVNVSDVLWRWLPSAGITQFNGSTPALNIGFINPVLATVDDDTVPGGKYLDFTADGIGVVDTCVAIYFIDDLIDAKSFNTSQMFLKFQGETFLNSTNFINLYAGVGFFATTSPATYCIVGSCGTTDQVSFTLIENNLVSDFEEMPMVSLTQGGRFDLDIIGEKPTNFNPIFNFTAKGIPFNTGLDGQTSNLYSNIIGTTFASGWNTLTLNKFALVFIASSQATDANFSSNFIEISLTDFIISKNPTTFPVRSVGGG